MAKISKRLVDGVVIDISDEEMVTIDAKETEWETGSSERELNLLRDERNRKLAETDWVITIHKEKGTNIPTAMKTYRQALRDITDDYTSLNDVVWPEKP